MKTKLLFIIFCIYGIALSAQQILIDEGIQVAGLQCFPVHGDTINYYYLPSVGALGKNEAGLPEFSYLRYITKAASQNETKSITNADGGAILHFLVQYTTPEQQINEAQQELKEKIGNHAILKGPVTLTDAKYTIISSILTKEGEQKKKVITTGKAPIFQNSKLAFSFELEPQDSKLLLESFKMATPDISVVFEFSFAGLSQDFQADVTVKWDEFHESKQFGGKGNLFFLKADVEKGFEELRKNNTIDLQIIGSNANLEKLLNTVYEKLMKLIFEPVRPEAAPEDKKSDLLSVLTSMAEEAITKGTGSLSITYKRKEIRTTGKSKLTFRGREITSRSHFITFNIGDIYSKYGNNDKVFKDVSLKDLAFLQRDVYVGVDGTLHEEFDKMINSVTVTLKKGHTDGTATVEEIVLNRHTLQPDSKFMMSYLNHHDNNLMNWRSYSYCTHWQFVGGGELKSGWADNDAAMINLYVPYKRKKVEIIGDLSDLSCNEIRTVTVSISYLFFGEIKSEHLIIKEDEIPENKTFEITLPNEVNEVTYEITGYKKDGTQVSKSGKNKMGVIFIDDLCED